MKRISKTLLAAVVAMQASLAQALGLGDITLKSSLNEPLQAEIRLRGVGDLDTSQIAVSLASQADFKRAGVERLYSLTELKFEVLLSQKGDGIIRLRTERPVREPYLDFLVEVRWPTGRVLREYTVLLDLPAMTPAPAPEVRAPSASRPGVAAPRAPSRVSGGGTWTGGDSYDVRSGDTLWSIANRTRPSGVSVQQMMVALQRNNPEAFIRGNMNLLRAGAILRIPADASISQSEALGEIEAQGRDWRGGGTIEQAAPLERPAAATRAAVATTPERAYLELAAGSAAGSGSASGGEAGGSGGGSLQEQLTAAEENLSAKERENAELQSRVAALEQQVQNYERLVELKSEGAAAAQQAVGASEPPAAEPGATTGDAAEPQAGQTPAPAPAPTPATPQTEERGLIARLMDNTLALGALAGLLLIAVVGFLFARRRSSATYAPVPEPSRTARIASGAAKVAETAAPPAREEPRLVERPPAPAPAVAAAPIAAAATVATAAAVAGRAAEPDVSDPVSEADIYVAYGRIERAQEILRAALDQDPGRTEVRLKLMEVLADSGNEEAFLEQYDELEAQGDAGAVDAAHEILAERGIPWLEPLAAQAPPVAQPAPAWSAPVAPVPAPAPAPEPVEEEEQELARLETEGGILHLDQDVELDLDEELARASEEPPPDEELALELGELALGEEVSAGTDDTSEPELDLGALGDLELGGDDAASLDAGPDLGTLEAEPTLEPAAAGGGSVEDDADLGLLDGSDEIETKLELARAYVDMGDMDGARDILDEVVAEGSPAQREQAGAMLERIRRA